MLGNTADCHAVDRVWNFDVASNFWKHHFLLVSPESAWKIEHGENLQTELQKNMGPSEAANSSNIEKLLKIFATKNYKSKVKCGIRKVHETIA